MKGLIADLELNPIEPHRPLLPDYREKRLAVLPSSRKKEKPR